MATADDLVHCPICLEIYDQPRALPCLHTFCNTCLQEYINAAAHATPGITGFECPCCRRHTPSPGSSNYSNWSSLFPLNHIIITLLDSKNLTPTSNQRKHTDANKISSTTSQSNPADEAESTSYQKEGGVKDDRFDFVKENEVCADNEIKPEQLPSYWAPHPPPHGFPPPPHGFPPPHHGPPPPHGFPPPPPHGPPPHHSPSHHGLNRHSLPHHPHGPPTHGPHGPHEHGFPHHWPPHGHPGHRGRGCHGRGRLHHRH